MIRLVLKLAIALAAAVLIGGVILVRALPLLFSSDGARRQVRAYCSRNLNRPVSREKISFSWKDGLSLRRQIADKDQSPLLSLSISGWPFRGGHW